MWFKTECLDTINQSLILTDALRRFAKVLGVIKAFDISYIMARSIVHAKFVIFINLLCIH